MKIELLPQKSTHLLLDGWMNCDFMSFSTVFQSYQDDGRLLLKGCAMELRLG